MNTECGEVYKSLKEGDEITVGWFVKNNTTGELVGKDITEKPDLLPKSRYRGVVTAEHEGYVSGLDAAYIGHAANVLGAGRLKKEDSIDYSAGVYLNKKAGDYVKKGDELLCLYSRSRDAIMDAESDIRRAYTFSDEKPETGNIILEEKF